LQLVGKIQKAGAKKWQISEYLIFFTVVLVEIRVVLAVFVNVTTDP